MSERHNETTIAGRVAAITPVQTVGSKSTPKQSLVITTDGRYPEMIAVEFFGDAAVDALTTAVRGGLGIDTEVCVGAYVKGREHGGRYYTSLSFRAGSLMFDPPPPTYPASGDDLPF